MNNFNDPTGLYHFTLVFRLIFGELIISKGPTTKLTNILSFFLSNAEEPEQAPKSYI